MVRTGGDPVSETIFPFVQPEPIETVDTLPTARECAWDFVTDTAIFAQGEPVFVERGEAVLVWAWHALHTPRWRYEIHSGDYGSDIENLIGTNWSAELKQAEARCYVEECLLASPYITGVRVATLTFDAGRLTASIEITSVYGTLTLEV